MSFRNKFVNLGHPNRIWTVSAVHGQRDRLVEIHKVIHDRFMPGDRLVYTGSYFCGPGARPLETLDELLHFRRTLLARPGMMPEDFVYLRGIQEELWDKILRLQFAPDARQVTAWIAQHHPGMDALLKIHGSALDEAARVAREGVMNLTRWTGFLRRQARQHPGLDIFFSVLRRAAFTENRYSNDNNLLFVHAGIDPALPLAEQGDSFWWNGDGFNALETPCRPFKSVIRGFDPAGGGVHLGTAAISLDGSHDGGGRLVCAGFTDTGDVLEILAA